MVVVDWTVFEIEMHQVFHSKQVWDLEYVWCSVIFYKAVDINLGYKLFLPGAKVVAPMASEENFNVEDFDVCEFK